MGIDEWKEWSEFGRGPFFTPSTCRDYDLCEPRTAVMRTKDNGYANQGQRLCEPMTTVCVNQGHRFIGNWQVLAI